MSSNLMKITKFIMSNSTICVCIKIFGLVQGVYFRAYTKEKAQQLGLNGFVRNDPDGTVYIECMGSAENIENFIDCCRKGSPRSVVTKVDVTELTEKKFEGFVIR